jgi:putative transposase
LRARDSILKARRQGRIDEKFPYKKKKYFNTGWDYQAIKVDYVNNIFNLGRPEIIVDGKTKRQKMVKCHLKTIPQNIVEIEVVWKGKLMLAIKYKEEAEYLQIQGDNTAAIDYGEIHSITSIDNSGNAIIITGRKLRSIKRLRNKEQGKIYSRLKKCTKGSKQYKKYMRALENLRTIVSNQINDYIHKTTHYYLNYCIKNNIKYVLYGDLDSCIRGNKQKHKGNANVRQKLSQWNFGQITVQLQNKLSKYGIELIKVKEFYTSSKCPVCGNIHKPKKRDWLCPECGYKQHRDIVGAINILNDNSEFKITYYTSKKYLQIA